MSNPNRFPAIPIARIIRPLSRSVIPISRVVRYVYEEVIINKGGIVDYSALHKALICYLKVTDVDIQSCHDLTEISEIWLAVKVDGYRDWRN